ncbi:MAG TPA: class I lanthipeptide [Chitinophaga sp.]|uniref:class I lanthipeptide n=1 Tax=Chitinophaga sp. TaxID=1869181 RepID=UPI002BEE66D2|nr:class I lanthipeptide [Chitinophaga sp.]HVI48712.1 class I lanthipeptide [Chitinophaga sp.]
MKKKVVNLHQKLVLKKTNILDLTPSAQEKLRGGATGTICPGGTLMITDCRPTSPSPRQQCYLC